MDCKMCCCLQHQCQTYRRRNSWISRRTSPSSSAKSNHHSMIAKLLQLNLSIFLEHSNHSLQHMLLPMSRHTILKSWAMLQVGRKQLTLRLTRRLELSLELSFDCLWMTPTPPP